MKKRSFAVGDVVFNSLGGVCDVVEVYHTAKKGKRRLVVKTVAGAILTVKPSWFHKCSEVFVPGCPYLFGEHIIQFNLCYSTCTQVSTAIRITDTVGYDMNPNYKSPYSWVLEGTVLNKDDFEQLLREGRIVPVGAKHISDIIERIGNYE